MSQSHPSDKTELEAEEWSQYLSNTSVAQQAHIRHIHLIDHELRSLDWLHCVCARPSSTCSAASTGRRSTSCTRSERNSAIREVVLKSSWLPGASNESVRYCHSHHQLGTQLTHLSSLLCSLPDSCCYRRLTSALRSWSRTRRPDRSGLSRQTKPCAQQKRLSLLHGANVYRRSMSQLALQWRQYIQSPQLFLSTLLHIRLPTTHATDTLLTYTWLVEYKHAGSARYQKRESETGGTETTSGRSITMTTVAAQCCYEPGCSLPSRVSLAERHRLAE